MTEKLHRLKQRVANATPEDDFAVWSAMMLITGVIGWYFKVPLF